MTAKLIFKILTSEQWRQAEAEGVFRGAPIDLKDGYIHFSTAGQVQGTADKHFAGMSDLVLAAVDASGWATSSSMRFRAAMPCFRIFMTFSNFAAVKWVKPMPLGNDGRHELPDMTA